MAAAPASIASVMLLFGVGQVRHEVDTSRGLARASKFGIRPAGMAASVGHWD